ncbi:MAG: peptidoglycan transglycosylase [Bacteroidota bacterium]|jgi:monofunctional biosynthetic peptidoglycan transglycosylase|nr:peptidoglycan transglycosylase [Bacteroidota bacterium]
MGEVLRKIWRFTWKTAMWFFIVTGGLTILFRFVPVPVTPLMLIRCAEQKVDGKEMKLKKDWVPLEKISGNLQLAVVCSEDQNFLKHNGIDFEAIDKAMEYNETHKRTHGASTISQQTAKNVFLWPGRSWIRKGFEVYFTFLIEALWNKQRIMEVYLNVIEMGNGVYGAQAASREFYGKDASRLSNAEAAGIAAVLPNPRKFNAAKPSAYINGRKSWIIRQMGYWGGVLNYEDKPASDPVKKRKKK